MRRWLVLLVIAWIANVSVASAHEVRPAFLKLTESTPGEFQVLWKQPIIEGQRLKITPKFPEVCKAGASSIALLSGTAAETYPLSCALNTGQIQLIGLERTLTDVFLDITYLDGRQISSLIKPSQTTYDLSADPESPAKAYFWIGVEHIWMGWDHLLFVLGLVLLVSRRQIWGVATAFTVAHSMTLALAALGLLSVPSRPVEILIALSIALLGVEVIRKHRGIDSLAARRPYLIGFLIGLIHGCGFASALADIGLPKGTELLALLLFNVGVEFGQFAVIIAAIVALAMIAKAGTKPLRRTEIAATYAMSGIAMYWVIERLAQYWV